MVTKSQQTKEKPRKAVSSSRIALGVIYPDVWALNLGLQVDGKKFSTNGREYIKKVMRDYEDQIVIRKAAQMGFTVGVVVKGLHAVTEKGWHTLYLLPLKTGAIAFVQQRIDQVIDSNKKLKSQFNRVDNRLHKQTIEGVALYVRGTNVVTELREIPVDYEIWDERDKFVENNLTEALARMDGSNIRKVVELSTPTVPGHGVDADRNWYASDQHLWEVPCPHCNRFQVLNFADNVRLGDSAEDSVLECAFCHKRITDDHRRTLNRDGRWVPQNLDGTKRGYHISQLNSPSKKFFDFISPYFDGQTEVGILRGFFNNNLGEPYAASGDKFTEQLLDSAIEPGFRLRTVADGPLYIGVDVGNVLHMKCSYKTRTGKLAAWDMRILNDSRGSSAWKKLDDFLEELNNTRSFMCVIDAHPQTAKVKELAEKYRNKVWIGYEKDLPDNEHAAIFTEAKKQGESATVTINRTIAFDQLIANYEKGLYMLPFDARELGEVLPRRDYNGFYAHHLEMARVEKEDAKGRIVARWQKTRNPDHWHHAEMFEHIAAMRKPKLTVPVGVLSAFQNAGSVMTNG